MNPPQLTVITGPPMEVGIKFWGIPGGQYQIQRSPDMTEGSWQNIATDTAGPTGAVEFTDEEPPQLNGFYRLRKP
jgi:hypothetical protein